MKGKRTFWTRLADAVYIIGKCGPLWWRLMCQVNLHMRALDQVGRQWYNGQHWVDRAVC